MDFFTEAIDVLKIVVTGLGAGYAIIGLINFAEGRSAHSAAKKEEGIGQLFGGAGIAFVGMTLIPKLATFFQV